MKSPEDAVASTSLQGIAVVIPAWQPDERLIDLVRALAGIGFASIFVVNDGSSPAHEHIFKRLGESNSVTVLQHQQNYGQGRSVKTGMRYAMANLPKLTGVVTADADGQHAVADIVRVAQVLAGSGARPVLGVRSFSAGVPLRSRFGNILTQYVFWFLSGVMITDTQSGLRGIPRELIPAVIHVHANRFEFAVGLLALFCRIGTVPVEVPIATIYLDGNRSSHFKPLRDSVRIYLHLARCYASTLVPACVDFAGFIAAYAATGRLAIAVPAGRTGAIAALTLFHLLAPDNRRGTHASFVRRAIAFAATGLISFGAIRLLVHRLGCSPVAAKIPVECLLYPGLGAIRLFGRYRGLLRS